MSISRRAWVRTVWGVSLVACSLIVCLLVVWSLTTGVQAQQPTPAKQYLIRCRLIENGEDGKPSVLAAPTVMTNVGKPAVMTIGGEVVPKVAEGKAARAFNGMELTATLLRIKDGQLVLDAALNVSSIIEASDKRLRAMGQSIRTVEQVTLKQPIIVPAGESNNERLEITVEEAPADLAANPAATSPTAAQPVSQPSPSPAPEAKPGETASTAPTTAAPAPLQPTPQPTSQPSNNNSNNNPLRGPLGNLRSRLRGR